MYFPPLPLPENACSITHSLSFSLSQLNFSFSSPPPGGGAHAVPLEQRNAVLPGLLEPPLHPRAPAHDLRRPVSRGLIGVAVAVAAVTASVAFGCILMCSHNAIAWLSALLSRFHLCLRSCARVCIHSDTRRARGTGTRRCWASRRTCSRCTTTRTWPLTRTARPTTWRGRKPSSAWSSSESASGLPSKPSPKPFKK